jgi:hypothetical protein
LVLVLAAETRFFVLAAETRLLGLEAVRELGFTLGLDLVAARSTSRAISRFSFRFSPINLTTA